MGAFFGSVVLAVTLIIFIYAFVYVLENELLPELRRIADALEGKKSNSNLKKQPTINDTDDP
ncbi:MAG: hypothetical protein A2655_04315 [Candidatus Yanofskybacteria bacterium RIFCSPHIGHO2_01_FULL_43_42]|uniref:Uncharacterized protein n=1 Tax=Candidatus Yanofskybacteria bacterium RIFCSPLOWO2_01_FULL_43_22 TaxID=1802695 RepID=A0A1F8GD91_9BACT|nr:MAG: hypothetical protein A2655_04315 [Candidatus Yanofskybacteria bacterium RIFCSPHIGHO2_01_FULL_43_42]OGN12715.1 MAG: hypothetical protein A3D48_01665 [Candidatus Yanofskybacteria bacterium RIFCSPHIGHO2_02_FULL_43_17]OGN23337.1 MAG: hypothetical protein A3A13_04435 [Candidatus Yanofskybacteria bacterium RIFCSPLOWO2_01_FULL_43_22]